MRGWPACHGYEPIETPVFEATEMYERGTGAGTDVVEKEMFSFTDRGGRALTLRPEVTPGVVRAVLGAHLDQERRPVRVRYAGPMFRYARPQAGRYHEFWQLGIEAIGERSPALDAEVDRGRLALLRGAGRHRSEPPAQHAR